MKNLKETCPICDGLGEVERDNKCGCGAKFGTYMAPCWFCNGTGKVEIIPIKSDDLDSYFRNEAK